MEIFKIFTVTSGEVTEGATVSSFALKNTATEIPVLKIGERKLRTSIGIVPVQLTKPLYDEWMKKGLVNIFFAGIGQTNHSNSVKLFARDEHTTDEGALFVSFSHEDAGVVCSYTGDKKLNSRNLGQARYFPFPGKFLCTGDIFVEKIEEKFYLDQQAVAFIPRDKSFRINYSKSPVVGVDHHYCRFDGKEMIISPDSVNYR